jgi:putative intracellular protease/amidase
VIGAICAAPTALHAAGIHLGSRITSYPSFEEELSQSYVFQRDQDVVTDAFGDRLCARLHDGVRK